MTIVVLDPDKIAYDFDRCGVAIRANIDGRPARVLVMEEVLHDHFGARNSVEAELVACARANVLQLQSAAEDKANLGGIDRDGAIVLGVSDFA